jgi:hypothetical protein
MSNIPRPSPTSRRSLVGTIGAKSAQQQSAVTIRTDCHKDGWIRLMREPWGHYAILQDRGGETCLLAEIDVFALAQCVYSRMRSEAARLDP